MIKYTELILDIPFTEKRTVNEIKALSGSVIRHKRDLAESDDPNLGYFTIGGMILKVILLPECKICLLILQFSHFPD